MNEKKKDMQTAERHAVNAIERDPFDATSLALAGHVRSILSRDYVGAISLFDRAIDTSRNCAIAWTRSSPTYSYIGDWKEGRARAEQGLRLSRLDRHVFYSYTALSLAAYTGGDYDEAIIQGLNAKTANEEYTANLRLLCASMAAAGRISEAHQVANKLLVKEPNFRVEEFCREYAYKEQERRDQLAAHLLAAGLPK
jgi:tetratricopeptide (TPR) repeat protein